MVLFIDSIVAVNDVIISKKVRSLLRLFSQIFHCLRASVPLYRGFVSSKLIDGVQHATPGRIVIRFLGRSTENLKAPVVQRVGNAIQRINHYPGDSAVRYANTEYMYKSIFFLTLTYR